MTFVDVGHFYPTAIRWDMSMYNMKTRRSFHQKDKVGMLGLFVWIRHRAISLT